MRRDVTHDPILNDVLTMIDEGDFDQHLALLGTYVEARKVFLRPEKEFRVGQNVEFNSHIIPKYLKGGKAVVKKVNAKTVIIAVEKNPRLRKWDGLQMVRAYKNTLDIID